MNCKPGDLATVITSEYAGKLVEVLYLAPAHDFTLPDGFRNHGEPNATCWVIRVLGTPVKVRVDNYGPGWRLALYGTANDANLRPIPGVPLEEEIDEEITA